MIRHRLLFPRAPLCCKRMPIVSHGFMVVVSCYLAVLSGSLGRQACLSFLDICVFASKFWLTTQPPNHSRLFVFVHGILQHATWFTILITTSCFSAMHFFWCTLFIAFEIDFLIVVLSWPLEQPSEPSQIRSMSKSQASNMRKRLRKTIVRPFSQRKHKVLQCIHHGDCAFCLEEMRSQLYNLPCQHVFHETCLFKWLEREQSCPLCRVHVDFQHKDQLC